jgi:hypothetical protein
MMTRKWAMIANVRVSAPNWGLFLELETSDKP